MEDWKKRFERRPTWLPSLHPSQAHKSSSPRDTPQPRRSANITWTFSSPSSERASKFKSELFLESRVKRMRALEPALSFARGIARRWLVSRETRRTRNFEISTSVEIFILKCFESIWGRGGSRCNATNVKLIAVL